MSRLILSVVAALTVMMHGPSGASAQSYPQRTVKFILPFGPASGTDIAARTVADRLSKRWGQPVVIENRAGGDSIVAIQAFLGANDDHTLLWMPVGNFAVHPYQHDKLTYNAERDLMPIANVTSLALSAAVPASLNVSTMREFVDLARANPDKFNAAAAQGSAEFLMSGFIKNMDLQIAKVPYRDIMQGPTDLAENRIQLLMSSLVIVIPLSQAGKVKVLAVTGSKRVPNTPDVPTMREAGYPALEMDSLGGIFGPRTMPAATRERIAEDVRAVVDADPTIAQRLQATGQSVSVRGPKEFAAGIKQINDQLADIAKVLGMKAAQ